MAVQTEIPLPPPSAQVVGNAFVEQYYHILHQTPESVYRFYEDSSVLSRPKPDGVMTSVTTKKGINEKICSFDYKNYKAEINTADAQDSFKDGVIVLVTGCLTGKDSLRRKFTQSFFLAPQDNGYFVLNDVFRYVEEENEPMDTNAVTIDIINDTQSVSLTPDPVQEQAKSHVEELQNVEGKTDDPIDNESQLANKNAAVDPEPRPNENHNSEPASSYAQEDAPKKSYASIVSSQTNKGNSGDSKVYIPTNTSRVAPTKTEKRSVCLVSQDSAPAASAPNAAESINARDEGDGHSIYMKNLPLNVTVTQLEAEFKKFGPIKQGGVQVRSNKGFCFGFVEFKDLNSMHNAIQASPITIGDCQAAVEIKRSTTQVGSARGRFPSRQGGFRNDSFRGRRNFSSGWGYGRIDFGSRGYFSGRGRGLGGEGYHQARGRVVHRSGPSQNAASE